MPMRTITNPILPGFHPDPSICRVGEDFYLVTSTFEYFPGLPIYHSKNLADWQLIGHGLSRPEQLQLSTKNPNAFGLYAPTLRFIKDRFYLVCTSPVNGLTRFGWTPLGSTRRFSQMTMGRPIT